MLVQDLVLVKPVKIYENQLICEVYEKIKKFDYHCFPVLNEEEKPVGGLIREYVRDNIDRFKKFPVKSIMRQLDGDEIIKESELVCEVLNRPYELFYVIEENGVFKSIFRKQHVFKTNSKKLELLEANLRGVLECVDTAIISLDKFGKILFINSYAMELLGIDENIAKETRIDDLIPDMIITAEIDSDFTEFTRSFDYNGQNLILTINPVESNNKIIGAICSLRNITSYNEINNELTIEKNENEVLKSVFETAYDGVIVVDADGYITMISDAYKLFLGIEREKIIGRHITDVIENTRLHLVAESGVPEIADLQKIKNNYMVASRIPVYKNGKLAGAIGKVMFRNIDEFDRLHNKIGKIEQQLENYKDELSRVNRAKYNFNDIVVKNSEMKNVEILAKKAAYTNSNVLIRGESGTGKELYAHSIHNLSSRSNKPFVKMNCAAIPEDLLESELFGYDSGAFTGAKKGGKIGKFEVADQGTIFLDEIGDMPLHMQAKLLRVIQEREIERIGSNKPVKIDTRIIAATNRNIEKMIEEKKFRLDLYYRLNVVTISIPPLRKRIDDIQPLSKIFINKYKTRYLKKVDSISEPALLKLKKYSWPGNIRELENVIERAINIMENETVVKSKHLPVEISGIFDMDDITPLKEIIHEAETKAIIQCLEMVNFNKTKAAKLLGLSRVTFYEKLDKYKITVQNKVITIGKN